jgi:ferredoxin
MGNSTYQKTRNSILTRTKKYATILNVKDKSNILHYIQGGKVMPRKIDSDECISCGVCVEFCSDDAISEEEVTYVIDPEKCTDCGSCEDECPVDAISAE